MYLLVPLSVAYPFSTSYVPDNYSKSLYRTSEIIF
jgi:hypothetical protein